MAVARKCTSRIKAWEASAHQWGVSGEYLTFVGFNQLSIVTLRDATRRDATRRDTRAGWPISRTRRRSLLHDMKASLSKHYRNYVCTHFTFVPWPIDRTAAPLRAAPFLSSGWPSRPLTIPPFGGKMTWARTCAATRPDSSNPFTTGIIFSIFRVTTTLSRAYRSSQIENLLSFSPRWHSTSHIWPDFDFFSIWLFPFFFPPFFDFSFLQYTVFYYTTLCVTAMRIILYNIM